MMPRATGNSSELMFIILNLSSYLFKRIIALSEMKKMKKKYKKIEQKPPIHVVWVEPF
jgi:hypothetical protein